MTAASCSWPTGWGGRFDDADPLPVAHAFLPLLLTMPAGAALLHADVTGMAIAAGARSLGDRVGRRHRMARPARPRTARPAGRPAVAREPVPCRQRSGRRAGIDPDAPKTRTINSSRSSIAAGSGCSGLLEGRCLHLGVYGARGSGKTATVEALAEPPGAAVRGPGPPARALVRKLPAADRRTDCLRPLSPGPGPTFEVNLLAPPGQKVQQISQALRGVFGSVIPLGRMLFPVVAGRGRAGRPAGGDSRGGHLDASPDGQVGPGAVPAGRSAVARSGLGGAASGLAGRVPGRQPAPAGHRPGGRRPAVLRGPGLGRWRNTGSKRLIRRWPSKCRSSAGASACNPRSPKKSSPASARPGRRWAACSGRSRWSARWLARALARTDDGFTWADGRWPRDFTIPGHIQAAHPRPLGARFRETSNGPGMRRLRLDRPRVPRQRAGRRPAPARPRDGRGPRRDRTPDGHDPRRAASATTSTRSTRRSCWK